MQRKEIEKKVKKIIIKNANLKIDVNDLNSDISLNDGIFALDSVQALEVLVGIEEEYDFFFNDEDMKPELFSSIDNLITYVEKSLYKNEKEV